MAKGKEEGQTAAVAENEVVKLIRMLRPADGLYADVHPAEAQNYMAGGFVPVDGVKAL